MDWYVQFACLDFSDMSEGKHHEVQEEVIAICLELSQATPFKFLTPDQLKTFQQEIAKCLKDLIGKGCAVIGPISYTFLILRPQHQSLIGELETPHLSLPNEVTIRLMGQMSTSSETIHALRYHFTSLLPSFANSVLSCPRCQKIFLQFRRHAKFCSRVCQSRAAMDSVREKKKDSKVISNTLPKKRRDTPKEKEGRK